MSYSHAWTHYYPTLTAFLLLLLGTAVLLRVGTESIESRLRWVGGFLVRRNLFRVPLARDVIRLDLLRILTGLVLLNRTFNSAEFIFFSPDPLSMKVVCGLTLTLAFLFTVGVATPLVSAALLFLNVMVFDTIMRTYTLGSDVLSMLLLVFTFLPAGTSLSVDSLVVRRQWPGSALLRSIYSAVGPPTFLRAVIAKTACLISYSLLCLYSATLHMRETFWLSGDVGYVVLSSSYFNLYYSLFRELFENYYAAVVFARASMMTMLVWYFGFGIFIVIGGVLRWFAAVWAFLFFLVSTFFLQLGWLGYYELIFLAILFWNRPFLNVGGRTTLQVLYDDRCSLCDRTIRFLRTVDIFKVAELRPLSHNADLVARLGIRTDDALKDLYGYDAGLHRTFHGYGFYLEISKRLLLLAPAFPVLLLGRMVGLGPAMYRVIADRRVRWFGVCERPAQVSRVSIGANPLLRGRNRTLPRALFSAFVIIHSTLAVYFLATLPPLQFRPPPLFMEGLAHVYGIMPINVFNKVDLAMNERWFTILAVHPDGAETLLPFTGAEGERLAWHRSDRVYFGNSLRWRRGVRAQADMCHEPLTGHVQEIIRWHRQRTARPVDRYAVSYFMQPAPRINPDGPRYFIMDKPKVTCIAEFDHDGKVISLR